MYTYILKIRKKSRIRACIKQLNQKRFLLRIKKSLKHMIQKGSHLGFKKVFTQDSKKYVIHYEDSGIILTWVTKKALVRKVNNALIWKLDMFQSWMLKNLLTWKLKDVLTWKLSFLIEKPLQIYDFFSVEN